MFLVKSGNELLCMNARELLKLVIHPCKILKQCSLPAVDADDVTWHPSTETH